MDASLKEIKYKIKHDWRNMSPRLRPMLLALLVACLHAFVFTSPIGRTLDSMQLRTCFSVRGPREIPRSVTVVQIDNTTYTDIKLPRAGLLPREYFAQVVERIAEAGAKVIILDMFFIAEGHDKAIDQRLAESFANTPSIIGKSVSLRIETDPNGKKSVSIQRKDPLPIFAKNAKMVLPMQVQLSDDGTVERIALPPEFVASMAVNVPLIKGLREFVTEELEEPGAFDYINYYGGPSSLSNVPFSKLSSSKFGKLV